MEPCALSSHIKTLAVFSVAAFIFVSAFLPGSGYSFEIGSSPNPVGSGARATGMGGAFIAVADDATAASWNPAGLVQLERPEISAVGGFAHRGESINSATHPELDGDNGTSAFDLNYLSAAYPFTIMDRNVAVSVNYQRLYDFNKDFSGRFNDANSTVFPPTSILIETTQNFRQRGGLSAVSPAFAFQITPKLSLGATVNFWVDPFKDNGWTAENSADSAVTFIAPPAITSSYRNVDKNEFSGANYNVGILYSPTASLTLGAVYKSGFTAGVKRTRDTFNTAATPVNVHQTDYLRLTMPQSYGIGAAYRFSDNLTCALDVYRTEWSEFIQDEDGTRTRPNILKDAATSKMDATVQVRAGGEYLFVRDKYVIPVRAGAFYDPEPSENSPNTFYGFSAGSGVTFNAVALDFSYTFRTGKTGEALGANLADSHITQHSVLVSAIVYF